MFKINKKTSMKTIRTLLATFVGIFVLSCFAQPVAPEVSIEIVTIDGVCHISLSWEPLEEAGFYYVYTTNNPYTDDWGEPIETVGAGITEYITEESLTILGNQKYFLVTAYQLPDWLVLVDGDQFNGNVTIDPFYINKYEVTQEEWIAVMGRNPSNFADEDGVPNNENLPVETVSWYDAVEYCNRLSIREGLTPIYSYNGRSNPDDWYQQYPGWNEDGDNHTNVSCTWEAEGYRLPTEAEWQHAANAGIHPQPFEYSGNDNFDEVAWCGGNEEEMTHPVGTKAPNGLGIYDMTGNVYEWCWDIYGDTFPSGGNNPRGSTVGSFRVARGGSWGFPADLFCSVTYRYMEGAAIRYCCIGLRCVRRVD